MSTHDNFVQIGDSSPTVSGVRIGIDIVHLDDMRDLTEDAVGVWLTDHEWQNMQETIQRPERLAGRFACKEAIMKALGYGIEEIDFLEIEIHNSKSGKPIAYLRGAALELWRAHSLRHLEVSISHHREYAVAVAIAMN